MTFESRGMDTPLIVSAEEGRAAREAMLAKEEEAVAARNALAAERRRLPWVRVEKPFAFEGPQGPVGLVDLFDGCRQLIVYRFFFQPGVADYPDGGCPGCSIFIDGVAHPAHLRARDTSLVLASPAPQEEIRRYKQRMGWTHFPWVTILDNDEFSRDFGVDEWFGLNVFLRDGDELFHSYFVTGHPAHGLGSVWSLLDLTPLGRQEDWEDSPAGYPQDPTNSWVRRHDEYENEPSR